MAPMVRECRLFLLPQELQDEIFDLAFFNGSGAIYIDAWRWSHREKDRRAADHTYLAEPFPEPKVRQLLVSKRFFLAAARALIENQSFDARLVSLNWRQEIDVDLLRTGIIPAFVRDLRCKLRDILYVSDDLPNLERLELDIDYCDFGFLGPEKIVHLDELDEDDFAKVLRQNEWQRVYRLCNRVQVLEVKPRDYPTNGGKELCDRNVLKLIRYIHEMRQKEGRQGKTRSTGRYAPGFMMPLYPGSKVRCGRNVGLWVERALRWKQEFKMTVVLAVWLALLLALVLWKRNDGMCLLL
ncbi:hypothetical protein D0867_02675 [Hortaea werneckii]|uniref:Uncharacterized protein n=1 Tax=Hortaea werneckii TaxID=91943 RepID=A0A3M7A5G1_HORWE|nr:hypothetical protein D0867_02675 [Hortaea werneckii]RMY41353.1 hypothetical protein D0866_00656 [Hortaea werneckii]